MGRFSIGWELRQLMAAQGIFKTTELVPMLAERGVRLSREQVYRLVTSTPARLNMEVLAALCDILNCMPNDLIRIEQVAEQAPLAVNDNGLLPIGDVRPVPARLRRPDVH